jgi:hypothetical protein
MMGQKIVESQSNDAKSESKIDPKANAFCS